MNDLSITSESFSSDSIHKPTQNLEDMNFPYLNDNKPPNKILTLSTSTRKQGQPDTSSHSSGSMHMIQEVAINNVRKPIIKIWEVILLTIKS